MGIDRQLVMCPPPQCYYTVPLDIAVKAARLVNDGIGEYVAGKPDRFAALGLACRCRTATKRPQEARTLR